MLLQPTISNPSLHHHNQNHTSSLSYSISFPSGFCSSSTLKSISSHKNPIFTCCSTPKVLSNGGTMDNEKRPILKWNGIFKKISLMDKPELGPASVLNQCENQGRKLTKWELSRLVKELRKFKKFKVALEVYEWMNSRGERFRLSSSDSAIQLDLIAKVEGISAAEEYFLKVPDFQKDNRIYGALLNAYVRSTMKEKAESLMDKMKTKGYANHALPFNVMMTLYMKLSSYDKVESMVSEMMEKKIPFDNYSYNIWISSLGSQGLLEKTEQAFEKMMTDKSIKPNWTSFSTMATMYIKLEQLEKAEDCLKKLESRIDGQDRIPYHYLISLYGSVNNKEEVLRVWNIYKSLFPNVLNLGYHAVISSLARLGDIEAAEQIYEEWLPIKSRYDPRLANVLLGWYVRNGLLDKVETCFNKMIESGGKPNSMSWEIRAEGFIIQRKISDALSCLKNAASSERSKNWKPKPVIVASLLKLCEQEVDTASKEALLELLKQVGCLENEEYMSYIPLLNGAFTGNVPTIEKDKLNEDDGEGDEMLLNQLQGSL